ncbi:MAG: response regulator [Candidatus Omnitrophota bacterium]
MKKILIVDDEKPICDMLEKFLAKKGYEASSVQSGEQALIKVKEERPHIVLLDIRMPGMGGIEALKRIREIDKEVGIVMITAVKEEKTGNKCLELGAYDYIIKPLDLDYLETVLMAKLLDFEL